MPRQEEISRLAAAGSVLATKWQKYRASNSPRANSKFLRYLRHVAGQEVALAFFARYVARCAEVGMASLVPVLPSGFELRQLNDLPERALLRQNYFDAGDANSRVSIVGFGVDGALDIPIRIKSEGTDDVFSLPEATVWGGSGLMTCGGDLIWPNIRYEGNAESLYPLDSLLIAHDGNLGLVRKMPEFRDPVKVDRAVSLLDSLSTHFGHFAFGLIPKLRVLSGHKEDLASISVLIDEGLPQNFYEILDSLELGLNYVAVPRGLAVTAAELIVPAPLKFFPDVLTTGAKEDLSIRALALPEFDFLFKDGPSPTVVGRKLSLLRTGTGEAGWRKNTNHEELIAALEGEGFRSASGLINDVVELHKKLNEAEIIFTDDGSINAHLLLSGVRGKTIFFLCHPGISLGGHQEHWVPGYLASMGNRVLSLTVETADANDRTSDWWVRPDLLNSFLKLM
jgi:hypothetical protein